MAKARYFPFHPDEYVAGIVGLSFEEQGVYWLCCTLIYSRNKPLKPDYATLARLGRSTAPRVKRVVETLIEKGKILETDQGEIAVGRVMEEISKANHLATNSKLNGKLGGRPKGKQPLSEPGPFPEKKPTNNLKPITNNPEQKSLDLSTSPPTQKTSQESEPGGSADYRFEGEIIKLDESHYRRLKKTFPHLNGSFEGELAKADAYYAEHPPPGGWWFPLTKWLARADKEASPRSIYDIAGRAML